MNAGIRNAATRCAVIQSVADRVATGAALNEATPIVASQAATGDFPNAVVLSEVLNVVQDDARVVVIQSAVTRYAVDQRVVDPDALVDSQDEVLPNVGQAVSLVDLLSQAAVQSEVASVAALLPVPRPA
jgi:hypothetical protein